MVREPSFSCFEGGRDKMPPMYASTEGWPAFDESVLSGKSRSRFRALKAAVELYLAFAPMSKVLAAANISDRRFRRLFARCGQVTPDGKILGWAALVAGFQGRQRQRTAKIAAGADGRSGFAGAFSKLLADVPSIGIALVSYLNATGGKHLRVNTVEFRAIHRRFVKICEEKGIAPDQYPLNTRERGRKSLRRWIDREYLPANANRFVSLEHGPDAGKLNRYGEGQGDANSPLGPYDVWIFDEVTVDVLAKYEIPNATGDYEELDLKRFFQIRLIAEDPGVTLAARQVFAAQASAADVAMLFWDALNGPPDIPKAFEGETLVEGAGYPSNIFPELRFAKPRVIRMDRALTHLSNHVQHIARKLFGGWAEFGAPRTPHERAQIESRFATQAKRVLHQLPGTTGTGPTDPVRKRAAVPVQDRLRAVEIEYLLDCYTRNENATPTAAAHNIAPLERLRRQLKTEVLVPRHLDTDKRKPYFFAQPVRVTVHANKSRGQRPYVNYLYERYTSVQLYKDYSMVGKSLLLRPDLRNLRTVMLFREDGREYGLVQVIGQWAMFPHDHRIRRLYGRLKREGQLGERADDRPLEALFAHLRKRAPADRAAALRLANLVEYLMRNMNTLDAQMAMNVQEWNQLQAKGAEMAVLPVLPLSQVALTPHVVELVERVPTPAPIALPRPSTQAPVAVAEVVEVAAVVPTPSTGSVMPRRRPRPSMTR